MTLQEVRDYITAQLVVPVNLVSKIINSLNKILDYISESSVDTIMPDWSAGLTFNIDGSGDGKYCIYPDTNGKKRIFETKTSANTGSGHEPPTNPAITENTYWKEISQSGGSAIKEWQAGLFGAGLIIVHHNHSFDGIGLYLLKEAARPFYSTNIETEIAAGQWERYTVTALGTNNDTDLNYFFREDFIIGGTAIGVTGWTPGGSGAGQIFTSPSTYGINTGENVAGAAYMNTGTTNTGRTHILKGLLRLATHLTSFRFRAALENLSDATDTYSIRGGFSDATNIAGGNPDNGFFFRYTHGVNGGKYQAVSRAATVETAVDTGVAATTTYKVFEIRANQAGTSIQFYIDNVLVATITTNIPTGVDLHFYMQILKSVGTTDRKLHLDWTELTLTRTTPR